MSNNVFSIDPTSGDFILDFPAYPGLTQTVATCNVAITLPGAATATSIYITKDDGAVSVSNYIAQNLQAYTYSVGSADIQIPTGIIQLADISQLNRNINLDPTGKVTATDSYHITNNSTGTMTYFVFGSAK